MTSGTDVVPECNSFRNELRVGDASQERHETSGTIPSFPRASHEVI